MVVLFTQGSNEIWTTVYLVLLKHLVPLVSSINPVCCLSVFVWWFSNNDWLKPSGITCWPGTVIWRSDLSELVLLSIQWLWFIICFSVVPILGQGQHEVIPCILCITCCVFSGWISSQFCFAEAALCLKES